MTKEIKKETIDNIQKNVTEQKDGKLTESIEEDRGHDLGPIMVDVTKREQPDGGYNLVVLMYVRPDLNPHRYHGKIKEVCKNLFGAKRDPEVFETYFRPANSVELATGEAGEFATYDLTIKPPKSRMYTIDGLRDMFNRELQRVI